MKTAKKTLALVLAAVMALGMFGGIGFAGALDYTDADQITYVEAVELMTSLGVFEGLTTGAFNPKGSLQRDAAVKIVAYVALGPTVAEGLRASNTGFSDVGLSHWASAYIAWAVENKIAVGFGDGTFGPTKEVTNLQFAKMLLVALGWGRNKEYEGENWGIRVSQKAAELKIFDGNPGGANHNVATREEACLYAFNLLKNRTPIVVYNSLAGTYLERPFGGVIGDEYGNFADGGHLNAAKVSGTVKFNDTKGVFEFDTDSQAAPLPASDPLYLIEVDAEVADIGRAASMWVKGLFNATTTGYRTQPNIAAATSFELTDVVLKDHGAGASAWADFWTRTEPEFVADRTTAAAVPVTRNGYSTSLDTSNVTAPGKGVTVLAIDNSSPKDGKIDHFVRVESVFAYVTGDIKETKNSAGEVTAVSIPGINGGGNYADSTTLGTAPKFYIGYENLKKGDGVIVTLIDVDGGNSVTPGDYVVLEKADSVDGQMSSRTVNNTNVTKIAFDGTSYDVSSLTVPAPNASMGIRTASNNVPSVAKDATVWLDSYGYAVAAKDASPGDPDYYVLLASAASGALASTYDARLLAMDGTITEVKVASDPTAALNGYFVTLVPTAGSDYPTVSKVINATTTTLGQVTTTNSDATPGSGNSTDAITLNNAPLAATGANANYGLAINTNNETVFLFHKTTTKTIDTFVGYANIPTTFSDPVNEGVKSIIQLNKTGGFAKYVYVEYVGTLGASGSGSAKAFFINPQSNFTIVGNPTEKGSYVTVPGFINGAYDPAIKIDPALFLTTPGTTNTAKAPFNAIVPVYAGVKMNNGVVVELVHQTADVIYTTGIFSGASSTTDGPDAIGYSAVSGNTIWLKTGGSATAYGLASSFKAFVFDGSTREEIAVADIVADDSGVYLAQLNNDGDITALYIVE